jgi:hypothetical protein
MHCAYAVWGSVEATQWVASTFNIVKANHQIIIVPAFLSGIKLFWL